MSMIKIIPPGAYPDSEDIHFGLVKRASSGLRGNDLADLIKKAGHPLAAKLKSMQPMSGEVLVYLNAMGSTESVGMNRNFDAYPFGMLKIAHPTFVKHARMFRFHQNKIKEKSYGIVKLSHFNEPVERVELVVGLNGSKEAAERNRGLLADEELDMLEKNAEIEVSMSVRVPHDVCSGCGNKAKTRANYCTADMCKYGGLKDNIGKTFEDGHVQYADNPAHDNVFFDISRVRRHADRTAVVFGKIASHGAIGGAELAELLRVTEPEWMEADEESPYSSPRIARLVKLANRLADRESSIVSQPSDILFNQNNLSPIQIPQEKRAGHGRASMFRALADSCVLLTPLDWLRFTTGESTEKCADAAQQMSLFLPRVFRSLVEDEALSSRMRDDPCKPSEYASQDHVRWACKLASDRSFDSNALRRRAWNTAMSNTTTRDKSASTVSPVAEELSRQYAIYQVGFLDHQKDSKNYNLAIELVLRHNKFV